MFGRSWIENQAFARTFDSENILNPRIITSIRSGGARGKQSEETKKRMSIAQKGRIVSESNKEKLSEILKDKPIRMIGLDNPMFKIGKQHPMYGKTHTPEARRLISKSKSGKPSPKKGKPMSEESRRKMSESAKKRHAK